MKDLKYLFAYTIPFFTFLSIYIKGFASYSTVIYAFLFIPIIELMLSNRDTNKYSKIEKDNRFKNIFFDIMLYINIPIIFFLLFYGLKELGVNTLKTYESIGLLFSLGILLATNGINVAHELGHRKSKIERNLSKLLFLPCLYMHFYLEHNLGHHKNVSTIKDPASARINQSLFNFWVTSVLGQYINAWYIQKNILKNEKKPFFSLKNDMLFYTLFQSSYLFLLFIIMGRQVLLYGILVAIISFLFLETINYIEHYGLSRKKLKSGRYERVEINHSWNSNHLIGRIVLYELTRHSDHHYKSSKKYQLLENIKESPQLPFGYPTSMLIASIPPIWFYIMNKRIPKQML
jgi:alkane 1-monooxygenase